MLNSKNNVSNPHFLIGTCPILRVIREQNLLPFFVEKLSFSLKLFSGHFHGESFIKTVRGPVARYTNIDILKLEVYKISIRISCASPFYKYK